MLLMKKSKILMIQVIGGLLKNYITFAEPKESLKQ
jgi:hypothetical protein